VERALQVLERRGVQPQLGLLKSTMLQLDSAFSERAYGSGSFSEFVEKLKKADFINVSGTGGRYIIERKSAPAVDTPEPEEAIPALRDVLEMHRLEVEDGAQADQLLEWMKQENPEFTPQKYGFQEFAEFLNFAQDKTVVRIEPDTERGLVVYLGAEFYPPAPPPRVEQESDNEYDEVQPFVPGQPTIFEPTPPPAPEPKPVKRPRVVRKRAAPAGSGGNRASGSSGNRATTKSTATRKRTSTTTRKKTAPPED
jgi:hypothetical protein